jgi:hypothetical protein
MEEDRDIHWSSPLEELVASEGEKCRGLAWINQKAEVYYAHRANAIAIPVIVLSTLAGTASVGSSSLFQGDTQISSVVIGLVSIGVGILNTISSYFSWARKAESHRIAYLQYSKLFSIIRVEMSLPRSERKEADQLLAQIRDGMERLAETTPSPPPSILEEFNKHFKDEDKSISRPIETNGLAKIQIWKSPSVPTKLDDVLLEIKNPLRVDKTDGPTRINPRSEGSSESQDRSEQRQD